VISAPPAPEAGAREKPAPLPVLALRAGIDRYERCPGGVRWGLALAWAGAIWWFSSRPPPRVGSGTSFVFLANFAHAAVFGALAALLLLAFGDRRRAPAASAALAAAWGVLDEVHQMAVPGRAPSVLDAVTDAVGAVLFVALVLWVRHGAARYLVAASIALPVAAASAVIESL
jgi:hypothetical protein